MDENKRNKEGLSGQPEKNSISSQQGEPQPVSNEQTPDPNPQQGSNWNNYQTRELGPESEKESYRPPSAENEDGGSLY